MYKLSTSTEYMYISVTGPAGVDLTTIPVSVALILESAGGEPGDGDYHPATWVNGQIAYLVTAGAYADGDYLAYVRLQSSPEDIRKFSGRVRIGDART